MAGELNKCLCAGGDSECYGLLDRAGATETQLQGQQHM